MSTGAMQLTAMIQDDGVRYHLLPNVILSAKLKGKEKITEITFATKCVDVVNAIEGRDTIGIVLWVPRSAFDEAVKGGAK